MFNFDGTLKIERYILQRKGFSPIHLRKIYNEWEILAYKNPHTGDERWSKLNYSEEEIQNQIQKYGEKPY